MKKPTSPCMGCEERRAEPNCHMTCERYLAFDEECKALRKEKIRIAEEYRIQKEIEHRRIEMAVSGKFYRSKRGKK
jgi:hypothetical protein